MDAPLRTTQRSRAEAPEPSRGGWLYSVCFEQQRRRRAIQLFGWMTALIIALVAFFTFQFDLLPLDHQITGAIQGLQRYPLLVSLMEAVSFLGYSPWNGIMVAVGFVAVAVWRGWKTGLFLSLATLVQGLITVALKFPIRIERPMETELNAPLDVIRTSSFPSGHVTMYVVFFGFLVYLLYKHDAPRLARRGGLLAAAFMIIVIGPARVLLGAHWTGDVIAAYLLGFFVLLLSIDLYEARFLTRFGVEKRAKEAASEL
jgi:undecaprenyl-diphosphatase